MWRSDATSWHLSAAIASAANVGDFSDMVILTWTTPLKTTPTRCHHLDSDRRPVKMHYTVTAHPYVNINWGQYDID